MFYNHRIAPRPREEIRASLRRLAPRCLCSRVNSFPPLRCCCRCLSPLEPSRARSLRRSTAGGSHRSPGQSMSSSAMARHNRRLLARRQTSGHGRRACRHEGRCYALEHGYRQGCATPARSCLLLVWATLQCGWQIANPGRQRRQHSHRRSRHRCRTEKVRGVRTERSPRGGCGAGRQDRRDHRFQGKYRRLGSSSRQTPPPVPDTEEPLLLDRPQPLQSLDGSDARRKTARLAARGRLAASGRRAIGQGDGCL